MKRFEGFVPEKKKVRTQLPAGGYVIEILKAREEDSDFGTSLVLAYDIAEGPFAGFFQQDFDAQLPEGRKWRGTYRLPVPADHDDSAFGAFRLQEFNNAVALLQENNPGYCWDFGPMERGDFSQLDGKLSGALVRYRQFYVDGRVGFVSEVKELASVTDIRTSNFVVPKPNSLSGKALQEWRKDEALRSAQVGPSAAELTSEDLTSEDLPF